MFQLLSDQSDRVGYVIGLFQYHCYQFEMIL